jgi:hypothetical protein
LHGWANRQLRPLLRFSYCCFDMHCRDLVELAALVAVHGGALIRRGRISESALEQYWSSSKARFEGWARELRDYQTEHAATLPVGDAAMLLAWRATRPVLEEILASEVLTRVWTAVACAYDRHRHSTEATSIVRSVYAAHLEARNQALSLLVHGCGFSTLEAVEMNRLRRRSERWCDMLLGYIVADERVDEFAFEPERTREFAADLREELNRPLSPFGWQLVLSSLRGAFQQAMSEPSPSAALNQQIAASILSCFHGELFDSTGLLQSLWMERIDHIANDAEGMLDELLLLENLPPRESIQRF